MFLSNASINRPVAMGCLIIALMFLGFNAYQKLGLEMIPSMDTPIVTIVTIYPGASPEELEADVAKKIEDAVVSIDGLKHVTSTCAENMVLTFVEFNIDIDVDIAAMDVRENIDLILSEFPEGVEDPMIKKFNTNSKPVLTMVLTGDAPLDEIFDFADNELSDKITVLAGVAEVQLIGGAEREVHVLLDRDALATRGIASFQVVEAIGPSIGVIPSGRVREGGTEFNVKYDSDFDDYKDIGVIEVMNENGKRNYIKDIARVEMVTKELRQKTTINGRPGIAVKVVKKSDANAVAVIQKVRSEMDELKKVLPGGMELIWVRDDESFTRALVSSAWKNVGIGILLTAFILFFFLYNLRSTLIVAVTMPLTIIIGMWFTQMAGYSLNAATLTAIAMSVGILVTNSIVVIEAIAKWLERTGKVEHSTRMGTGEAAVAVFASAGTNLVVLFPIAMAKSTVGEMLQPLVITMAIMTAVSLFISFTLTPILAVAFLKSDKGNPDSIVNRMERGWNRFFEGIRNMYGSYLSFAERNRPASAAIIIGAVVLFLISISLGRTLGVSFFPDMDMAQLNVKMEFPTRYNLDLTVQRTLDAEERLKDMPELKDILVTSGKVEGIAGQNLEGVYLAQIVMTFSERDERELTIHQLVDEARRRMEGFSDCIVTVSIPLLTGGSGSDLLLEIYGDDRSRLDELALTTKGFSDEMNSVKDTDTSVRAGKPELRIIPRRAILSDLGAPPISLGLSLRANLEGITAGTYKEGDRNFDIVVKFDEKAGKKQVRDFQFPGSPGHPMLLSSIGTIQEGLAPIQIIRKDKQRISQMLGTTTKEAALGTVVNELSARIDESGIIPAGYKYEYGGPFELMNEGQAGIVNAGLIAIVLVFLTLAAILESYKQPFITLTTIPLALIGVIGALYLAGYSLSVFVTMGIVMLLGIVVNNAILIMDQFNINVRKGMQNHMAMIEASKERLRPILMITIAAVLGMAPLAFSKGIGSESMNDIGIASVGGILSSGVLTIFILPVLYNLFTKRDVASARQDDLAPEDPEAEI